MRAIVVVWALTLLVATGCDSGLGPDPSDELIDVCASALSGESFFPIEMGKTWNYMYDGGDSGPFASSYAVGRWEGVAQWTVIELECSGRMANFRIEETYEGARHSVDYGTGEWIQRDTSWTNVISGMLRDSVLTLKEYTDDLPDVNWLRSETGDDTLRISRTFNIGMGGSNYADIELVRSTGMTYSSVGRQGRPVFWRTISLESETPF
jgi:hypothetical protein